MWYEIVVHFLHISIAQCTGTICQRLYFAINWLWYILKIHWPYKCMSVSGHLIWFSWSSYLSLCQYHNMSWLWKKYYDFSKCLNYVFTIILYLNFYSNFRIILSILKNIFFRNLLEFVNYSNNFWDNWYNNIASLNHKHCVC